MAENITLEDFRNLLEERFIVERDFTRSLVQESAQGITGEFQSFIDNNFDPAMAAIGGRFDELDDRVDRLAGDVTDLRIDMRHVKQALRPGQTWQSK
jgi:hypothetical protein